MHIQKCDEAVLLLIVGKEHSAYTEGEIENSYREQKHRRYDYVLFKRKL